MRVIYVFVKKKIILFFEKSEESDSKVGLAFLQLDTLLDFKCVEFGILKNSLPCM
jgi:hypothetical protein